MRALEWTPWGKIGYKIEEIFGAAPEEVEKIGHYRFYWGYWLAVILLLLYLARKLHGRKDFIFEKNDG